MIEFIRHFYEIFVVEKDKNRLFWILVILGLALCSVKAVDIACQSLWMDECFNIIGADMIRDKMIPRYPSGYMYYKALFCSYVFAIVSGIFGDRVTVYRMFSLFIHFMTPVMVYVLGKGFIKREILFVSGLILYLHPWETEYARTALYHPLLQFMVSVSLMLFIGNVFFGYKRSFSLSYVLTGLTHQLGFGLAFSFAGVLLAKPRRFFERRFLTGLVFWVFFFAFIVLQEALLWRVGYVNMNQEAGGLKGIAEFFLGHNHFVSLGLLRESHPVAFTVFSAGFILMIMKVIYMRVIKRKLEANDFVLLYLMLVFGMFLFSLSFLQTHHMVRYLFPFHFIFIILVVGIIYRFGMFFNRYLERLSCFFRKRAYKIAVLLALSFILVDQAGIKNNIEIIERDYDNWVKTDIIYRSHRYFPIDHASPGEYVRHHRRTGDVVIAIHHLFQYMYAGDVDYWLWSGAEGTWDAWEIKDRIKREVYLGIPVIDNAFMLDSVIREAMHKGKRVWLITSPSEREPAHISPGIKDYIGENYLRIKWMAKDGAGKVLLFEEGAVYPERLRFEAEWGLFDAGGQNVYDMEYVSLDRDYRTACLFIGPNFSKARLHFRKKSPGTKVEMAFLYDGKEEERLYFNVDDDFIDAGLLFTLPGRANFRLRVVEGPVVDYDYFEIL